jgi:osmotically inducible lipoprotein OsmB
MALSDATSPCTVAPWSGSVPVRPFQEGVKQMKKIVAISLASAIALSLGGCYSPGERAAGGALLGSATGAALGAAASGGRAGGTLAGAAIGGLVGATAGAATAPCPYGTYRDYYGNVYCR